MDNIVFDNLKKLLDEKNMVSLHNEIIKLHKFDIANFIDELKSTEAAIVFRMLPKTEAADVFSYLDGDSQENLISAFTDEEVVEVVNDLAADDAIDMLEELPANAVSRVLKLADPDKRNQLNRFLRYPEDSAGRLMNPDYLKLKHNQTVKEALNFIRTNAEPGQILESFYVTDNTRILEGIVSLKTLILSDDDKKIIDVMETDFPFVSTDVDQEEVVHIFRDYDLLTLPVVDKEKRLLGFITVDDAIDALQEEATEDFEKMAGMSPSDRPYLKTSIFKHAKSRVVWLLVLMISGIINGGILERFEHAFIAMPILVTFMPMLTDTGGNAGSQSSTMIIRGMALNELKIKDIWLIVWKELRISVLVGAVLALTNFLRIYLMHPERIMVAIVVSIAMMFIVILAKLLGSILPLLAQALGLDPAIMAAPLITTVVDAIGLITYFLVAEAILGL
ncbi:MAG: magnesium transporter [Andreesenia angusta]|nr:magnesium transporter [Andreesenia angusta]